MKLDRRGFLKTNGALFAGAAFCRALQAADGGASLSASEQSALLDQARKIFTSNRAEVEGRVFHYPSAGTYHSFFAWDAGTNVIGGKHIFAEDALRELQSIYSFETAEGRIPHEVRFGKMREKDPVRNLVIYLVRSQFDKQGVSALIDPPNYIYALWDYSQFKDDERLWPLVAKAEKAAEYLFARRDLFGDGLVSIIHPWESGTDAAAVFDEPMGIRMQSPAAAVEYLTRYIKLLDRLAKINFDPKQSAQQNIFAFEDVGFNSWLALGLVGLSKMFGQKGDKTKAEKYVSRAKAMVAAMEKIFWDEKEGFFYPRYDASHPRLSRRKCATGMLPLMTGLVSQDKAHRVIEEHLKNPREFWTPYPVGFNAESELAKDKLSFESMMLWRGHCVWSNMDWGLALALDQYGEKKTAQELATRFSRLILREGFREFYDSRTGQGQGAKNFTWPALALDLISKLSI